MLNKPSEQRPLMLNGQNPIADANKTNLISSFNESRAEPTEEQR